MKAWGTDFVTLSKSDKRPPSGLSSLNARRQGRGGFGVCGMAYMRIRVKQMGMDGVISWG